MKRSIVAAVLISAVSSACIQAQPVVTATADGDRTARIEACNDLAGCLALISEVAEDVHRSTEVERALAKRIACFGDAAIPPVLALLRDEDPDIRDFAEIAVGHLPGINESHLPDLMRAQEQDNGRLAYDIARIGTPEALQFLCDQFSTHPGRWTIYADVFESMGEAAFPCYWQALRCRPDCNENQMERIAEILDDLDDVALPLLPELVAIAQDEAVPMPGRIGAIRCIGSLGTDAASAAQPLKDLSLRYPGEFREVVSTTLFSIKDPSATVPLVEWLQEGTDPNAFGAIAELGPAGVSAGPALRSFMHDPRAEFRLRACLAISAVEYREAISELIAALDDKSDWRLVRAAAGGLGELRAEEAIPALERIQREYWFPPVRDVAAFALALIRREHVPEADIPEGERFIAGTRDHGADFGTWNDIWPHPILCPRPSAEAAVDLSEYRWQPGRREGSPATLSYRRKKEVFDPEKGVWGAEVDQVPEVTLVRGGDILMGVDDGEFVGQLVHRDAAGNDHVLLDANMMNILPLGGNVVVVTGMRHMMTDEGALYLVTVTAKGASARWWRQLPGAPHAAWLLKDGRIRVDCSFGSVLVAADGTMAMASCSEGKGK